MSQIMAIKKFFGLTTQEAQIESKALTPEDKQELAELAAEEMGVELR